MKLLCPEVTSRPLREDQSGKTSCGKSVFRIFLMQNETLQRPKKPLFLFVCELENIVCVELDRCNLRLCILPESLCISSSPPLFGLWHTVQSTSLIPSCSALIELHTFKSSDFRLLFGNRDGHFQTMLAVRGLVSVTLFERGHTTHAGLRWKNTVPTLTSSAS